MPVAAVRRGWAGKGIKRLGVLPAYPQLRPPVMTDALGWWDASVLSSLTLTGGTSRCTAIADLSGNGINATEETSAAPGGSFTVPEQLQGRGVILSRPQMAFTLAGLSGQDRTQTLFFAGCVFSLGSARVLIGASANNGRVLRIETNGRPALLKRNVGALATGSAALAVTAGVPFVCACVLTATTIDLYVNQVTPESFSDSTALTSATGSSICGGDATTTTRNDGYFCEVLICDGSYSSGDVNANLKYLMSKWGITP